MSPLVVRHQCDNILCCKSRVVARDRIEVYPPSSKNRSDLYFPLHVLLSRLPEVPVHGIPTIQRCVINRQKNGCFQLFAEGVNLRVCPGSQNTCYGMHEVCRIRCCMTGLFSHHNHRSVDRRSSRRFPSCVEIVVMLSNGAWYERQR